VAFGREVSVARIAELVATHLERPEIRAENANARPGDVDRHYADIDKARRLFSYEPKIPLEEGLARTIAWFEEQGLNAQADDDAGAPNW
jgi:nucleoside-diphosphate-sugar epimerase